MHKKHILMLFLAVGGILNPAYSQQGSIVFHTSFEIDSSKYCVFESGSSCANCLIEAVLNEAFTMEKTPNIFSPCDSIPNYYFNIPHNAWGYQLPYSGNNYLGFCTVTRDFFVPTDYYNTREWVGVKLTNPLKPGFYYRIEYYVSPADSVYQFSIPPQIYFNADSIKFEYNFNETDFDTINYSKLLYVDSTIYTNTNEWYKISGIYHADGTEKYLYLGNFINDQNSPIIWSNVTGVNIMQIPYYYVDDITIYELDSVNAVEENKQVLSKLYPNPTNGLFYIEKPALQSGVLELYNLQGQLLQSIILPKGITKTEVDLSSYSNGLYLCRMLYENGKTESHKLIVQH